jgi:uncharacterized protein with PIN domain
MRQELYNQFDKRMKRVNDKDIAEWLIRNKLCLYCDNELAEEVTEEIDHNRVVSKIFHCRNCDKAYYIPKSWYEELDSN